MSAFNEESGLEAGRQGAGSVYNRLKVLGMPPDQYLHFIQIGSDQCCQRKEFLCENLDSVWLKQDRTTGSNHNRVNDDGSAPADNPFVGQDGVPPTIWSYGHRNAQGIDWQPGTGLQFQTEHGPSGNDGPGGGDEVNIVERGKNYGWPVIHHGETKEGMESPLLEYTPAVAPASGRFYTGSLFPAFKGDFFFGCLRGETLIRVRLEGRKVVSQERLLQGVFGRLRAVAIGPDGAIYVSTSNRDGRSSPAAEDDRILRLRPD